MDRKHVAALLAYADRLDPRTAPVDRASAAERLEQWADLLSDVAPTAPHPGGRHWDASQVVRRHIATSPYPIKPSDVSRPWHDFRRDVIDRHHDPVPAVDPDDTAAYREAIATTRHAVAIGAAPAGTYRELTAGTREERNEFAAARLTALGTYVPRTVAQALADFRPRRSQREQLAAADRPDPLDVPCEHPPCRAATGEPCRNIHRAPRAPHPSRIDAATARHYAPETAA
jgi:hypothetical protein